MAELKNPIQEAERYLDNARRILSEKAEKEGNYYKDRKYVKMAGNSDKLFLFVIIMPFCRQNQNNYFAIFD